MVLEQDQNSIGGIILMKIQATQWGKRICATVFALAVFTVLTMADNCRAQNYDYIVIYPQHVGVFTTVNEQQFVAFGIKVGQVPVNITKMVGWTSSNTSLVTIDANGLAKVAAGITYGQVKVTASYPKGGGGNLAGVNSLLLKGGAPAGYTVTANATGAGEGTVISDVGGINFTYQTQNSGASTPFDPAAGPNPITITATVTSADTTATWTGCESTNTVDATTEECIFTDVDGNKVVTVDFTREYTVTVDAAGDGTGTVVTDVGGINFSYDGVNPASGTTTPLDYNSTVSVGALATGGGTVSWGSTCTDAGGTESGTTPAISCTLTLDSAKSLTVTFVAPPPV